MFQSKIHFFQLRQNWIIWHSTVWVAIDSKNLNEARKFSRKTLRLNVSKSGPSVSSKWKYSSKIAGMSLFRVFQIFEILNRQHSIFFSFLKVLLFLKNIEVIFIWKSKRSGGISKTIKNCVKTSLLSQTCFSVNLYVNILLIPYLNSII